MKKQIVVYSGYIKDANNAGPKAKIDIENILVKEYNAKIVTLASTKTRLSTIFQKVCFYLKPLLIFNKIIIIQYPLGRHYLRSFNKDTILFIHDIEGLRNQDTKRATEELKYFNSFKYIICHNKKMKDYLILNGIKSNIYTNEIFDYLISGENKEVHNSDKLELVYAGNISKSAFYKHLDKKNMNYTLNIYAGSKPEDNNNPKIKYMGCFKPDELPSKIKGNLGLVWDGDIDDNDEYYKFKNYTKYNNPHKLSCYLAAGIPVIVWDKAAISDFVKDNNIGYIIKKIDDINNIDLKDYKIKFNNVKKIQKKLIKGEYTINVINKVLKDMDK